jgi:hypothetical protein
MRPFSSKSYAIYLLRAGLLLRLFLYPEDGADMFLRNSVDFQRATRRYIPEDKTFHHYNCYAEKGREAKY